MGVLQAFMGGVFYAESIVRRLVLRRQVLVAASVEEDRDALAGTLRHYRRLGLACVELPPPPHVCIPHRPPSPSRGHCVVVRSSRLRLLPICLRLVYK